MNFGQAPSPRIILHLWLYEVLPGLFNERINYCLPQYKMSGAETICRNKIREGTYILEKRKMKLISLNEELHQNTVLFLSKRFGCKFYHRKVITKQSRILMNNWDFTVLKDQIDELMKFKFPYLVSVRKDTDADFTEYFKLF